jgi:crossover junction endodeoxyribonuclease RusA
MAGAAMTATAPIPARVRIELPWPPTVNHLYINLRHGKGRAKSPQYKLWQEKAGWAVKEQRPGKISGTYSLSLYCHRPDRRKRDIGNLIKAIEDLLVELQVIPDDSKCSDVHAYWIDADPVPGGAVTVELEGVDG